jgi:hypothetical protein
MRPLALLATRKTAIRANRQTRVVDAILSSDCCLAIEEERPGKTEQFVLR